MGGKIASKEELVQLEALTNEGLTCREIAERLGRSPAAIRNLRYKKQLVSRTRDETKALLQTRDELISIVRSLQGQKTTVLYEVDGLKKHKEKLERIINLDKYLLELALSHALTNLKQQRPELFTLSGPEQISMLLRLFLKK